MRLVVKTSSRLCSNNGIYTILSGLFRINEFFNSLRFSVFNMVELIDIKSAPRNSKKIQKLRANNPER